MGKVNVFTLRQQLTLRSAGTCISVIEKFKCKHAVFYIYSSLDTSSSSQQGKAWLVSEHNNAMDSLTGTFCIGFYYHM